PRAGTVPIGAVALMMTVSVLVSKASSLVAGNGRQKLVSWAQAMPVSSDSPARATSNAMNLRIMIPSRLDVLTVRLLQKLGLPRLPGLSCGPGLTPDARTAPVRCLRAPGTRH